MKKVKIPNFYKIKLQKGDLVMVLRGRLKGQKARVTALHPKLNKVTLENINLIKKHIKPTPQQPQGGIIEINRPLFVNQVALVEPKSQKPSRIAFKIDAQKKKERIYQRTQKTVVSNLTPSKVSKSTKSTKKVVKS